MTLSPRHRIWDSSPGGLSQSTPRLGHGGSPKYWIFTSEPGTNEWILLHVAFWQSWQYRDSRKPYSYFEWHQGFFIVHTTGIRTWYPQDTSPTNGPSGQAEWGGAGSRYVNSFLTLRNLASHLNFHMRVALLLNYINYVTQCTNIYRIHVNMCDVMIVFNISW